MLTREDLEQIRLLIKEEIKPIRLDVNNIWKEIAIIKHDVHNIHIEIGKIWKEITEINKTYRRLRNDVDTTIKYFGHENIEIINRLDMLEHNIVQDSLTVKDSISQHRIRKRLRLLMRNKSYEA